MIKKPLDMDVEPKIGGVPSKWMVNIRENPMNKWMIWGFSHIFWKHPYAKMASLAKYMYTLEVGPPAFFKKVVVPFG